jgi:hypothetical protein
MSHAARRSIKLNSMRASGISSKPPPRPRLADRLLLPIADRFMLLMLSRPPTGTLRSTPVTPASIVLAALTFAAAGAAAVWLVTSLGRWAPLALLPPLALLAALAVGSAALALYGLLQRR